MKFSTIIVGIGFQGCHYNHSDFVRPTTSRIALLAVYMDNILLTGSDKRVLTKTKDYNKQHFVTKKKNHYFLGI